MKRYNNTLPMILGIAAACLAVGLVVGGVLWLMYASPAPATAPAPPQQAVALQQVDQAMTVYVSDDRSVPERRQWHLVDENGKPVEGEEVHPMIRRVLEQAASEEMFVCPTETQPATTEPGSGASNVSYSLQSTTQSGATELPAERVTTCPTSASDPAVRKWDQLFRDPDSLTTQPSR